LGILVVATSGADSVAKHKKPAVKKNQKKYAFTKEQYLAMQKMMKKGVEPKLFDVQALPGTFSRTTAPIKLTSIAQGVSIVQRVGDQCNLRYMEVRFNLYPSAAAVISPQFARVMIFRWDEDDAVAPTLLDVLTSFTAGAGVWPTVVPWNFSNVQEGDLRVLFDKVYPLVYGVAGSGSQQGACDHVRIGLKGAKIVFNAGAVTGTGHLYMVTILGSDSTGVIEYQTRVVYEDA